MANEYSVVVKEGVTKADIIDSLSRDTTLDTSVNSNEVPDRAIAISTSQQRPHNSRVFEVELEAEEAIILNNNPEVSAVEVPLEFNENWAASQTLLINRNYKGPVSGFWNSSVGYSTDNYGLWRHSNTVNDLLPWDLETVTKEWANTAEAGLGVDIFVMDNDMPRWDLNEFDDQTVAGDIVPSNLNGYNAGSRFVSLDWSAINSVLPKRFVGTGGWDNSNRGEIGYDWFLKDCDNDSVWARTVSSHATVSMSIVGGNKFGWAKQARLYAMPMKISCRGTGMMPIQNGFFVPPQTETGIGGWTRLKSKDARSLEESDADALYEYYSDTNQGVGPKYYFDAITMFHNWKKDQVTAGNLDYAVPGSDPPVVRPTVVNASVCPVSQYTDITGVYFRGRWFGDVLDTLQDDTYPTLTGPGWTGGGWGSGGDAEGSNAEYGWGTTQGPVPPIYKFGIAPAVGTHRMGDLSSTTEAGPYRPTQRGALFPVQSLAMQADVHEMTDAGVIFVTTGHNTGLKMDIPGGLDYDNFFTTKETTFDEETAKLASVDSHAAAGRMAHRASPLDDGVFGWPNMQTIDLDMNPPYNWMRSSGQPVFYNRGGTHFSNNTIVVGNMNYFSSSGLLPSAVRTIYPQLSTSETAEPDSSRGPRIDIWAAGSWVIAQDAAADAYAARFGGTSVATPQVAGMVAILAGKYPTTTPAQMRAFVRSNTYFHSSNGIIDYHALLGGVTPVSSSTIAGEWGANGDFNHFASNVIKHHLNPLLGATTNVAYLNPTTPYDTSQLTILEDDLDYLGHSNPAKYDAVIADPDLYSTLNYTSEMTEKLKPRVGSDWGFRYYKIIGYDDMERTIPSGEGSDFGQSRGGSAISNLIIYERTDDGGERVLLGGNQEIISVAPATAQAVSYIAGVTREKSDMSHLNLGNPWATRKGVVGDIGGDGYTADSENLSQIPYAVSNAWIQLTSGASSTQHEEESWGGFWYYFMLPFKNGEWKTDGSGELYGVPTGIASNCTRSHILGDRWRSYTRTAESLNPRHIDAWGHEYFVHTSKALGSPPVNDSNNPLGDYGSIDPTEYPAGRKPGWMKDFDVNGYPSQTYYPHHGLSAFNHTTFFDSRTALGHDSAGPYYLFNADRGIEGMAANDGDYPTLYNMGAPPCNYSFIPAENAPTEISLDFGRQVTISNIKWNTLSHNHFNTAYLSVYGSDRPFYVEETGPHAGSVKIAELNRGDAYIANYEYKGIKGIASTPSGRWQSSKEGHLVRAQATVLFDSPNPYANGVMSRDEPGGDPIYGEGGDWRRQTGWSTQFHDSLAKRSPSAYGTTKTENSSLGGASIKWSSITSTANIST
jgi:hypothetical protein